jgi:Galactose oxidase, central domain
MSRAARNCRSIPFQSTVVEPIEKLCDPNQCHWKSFPHAGEPMLRSLITLAVLTSSLLAQAPSWVQAKLASSPQPRVYHAMTYDAARQNVVLFGGQTEKGGVSADTWIWDGKTWAARPSLSSFPSRRIGHAMAYDAARQVIVLFGGANYSKTQLGDTWLWDGKSWTLVQPPASPGGRAFHSMAYDATRKKVVLFGGYHGPNSNQVQMNDTWLWDGKTWTRAKPVKSPLARSGGSMTFDAARQRVVLFGGATRYGPVSDTWLWNGANWTQVTPPVFPSSSGAKSMTYDAARERVVYCAQPTPKSGLFFETWLWDGKSWTRSQPLRSPTWRANQAIAYDVARQKVVMFGGAIVYLRFYDDTWILSTPNIAGSFKSYGSACGPQPLPILTSPATGLPNLGRSFVLQASNAPSNSSFGLMSFGASKTLLGNFPLPISLSSLGMTGCTLYQSQDVAWTFPISAGAGQVTLPIPNQLALLRSQFHVQAFLSAPKANAASLISTNAGTATVGNQ